MGINIDCTYNDSGAWCKHKEVKRSLFGLGARCCKLFPYDWSGYCRFQEKIPRPTHRPPAPPPRKKEG